MREQQFAVAKIEPWCLNRTCDQLRLVLEVVPVMWGVAGTICND
jgi:hypothetical protein